MIIETKRFGEIEIDEKEIITMPEGPLGYHDANRWIFIDEERAAPFRMLQSLDYPNISFLVVDPRFIYPEYKFDLGLEELKKFSTGKAVCVSTEHFQVYTVVSMSKEIHNCTTNLQGPFVLNTQTKMAFQFVLLNKEYNTRMPIIKKEEQI